MADPLLRLDDFLPYRLSLTSNLVSDAIARSYQALFGLKIPEWRLIAVIAERNGVTQQDIVRATRMDKVTISRAAAALESRGLIERAPNRADGRSQVLQLTAAGHDLYAQVAPKALDLENRIFGSLDARDLARFRVLLAKIEAAVEQLSADESDDG
jgi:DNA-binding MarR family transcriptional regulator